MDNIQSLTDLILKQAHDEADELLRAAHEQQTTGLAETERKLEQVFLEKKEQLAHFSDERIKTALLRKQAAVQKERTRYKGQLMDTVFLEAENELCRIPAKEFFVFFHQAVDRLPLRGEYIVRVGERTAKTLEKTDWEALCVTKDAFSITVDTETIPNEGGFMLERFPLEYSFLYHELLADFKAREGSKIMKQLLD